MFTHAITRKPGANFAEGLTTSTLGTPLFDLILEQHAAYVETLRSLGLEVIELDADPRFPDGTFVEDSAVVTPDVAVITRQGAPPRRGEEEAIEPALSRYRPLERIEPPGTVDGGDVLMIGERFFVGLSGRTNEEGARQLAAILRRHDCSCEAVPVGQGLHLKSDVAWVGGDNVLVTAALAAHDALPGLNKILVAEGEEYAANAVLVGDRLLFPAGFPRTRLKLELLGLDIVELEMSEARKMDGGLSCLSLRF